jgi:hypothetical protein
MLPGCSFDEDMLRHVIYCNVLVLWNDGQAGLTESLRSSKN